MPKVLRIINRLNIGGPTYNAALLTKYLAPEFETKLVAGIKDESEAGSEFILDNLGIEADYIPDMYRPIHPFKDYTAYQHIKKIIQEYKPDIVHTHAAKAGALGRMAASECGVPVVLHTFHGHVFHSYFSPLKTRFFIEVERWLANKSSHIIAISQKQKEELNKVYNIVQKDKISIVPLGFDLDRFYTGQVDKRIDFRAKYKIADDEIAIGIVGRLVKIKNHALFLQALQQLIQNTDKKIRAFIVGDGEKRPYLEQLASELNIQFTNNPKEKAELTFTSWIKNIDEVYAGLDLVCLSSLNEGTPVSLIEAQAANKAIATTDVGGVRDVVIPGLSALLSPSEDVDALAQNLLTLVADDKLRQSMGQQGSRYVKEKYTYTRLVDDMAKLYDRLLWNASPEYRKTKIPKPTHYTTTSDGIIAEGMNPPQPALAYSSPVKVLYK